MSLADQLMVSIDFCRGRLFADLPGGFTGDPRQARPVLVKIGRLGPGQQSTDSQERWTFGRVAGGGRYDGRHVKICGDISVYRGGYILCAIPDEKSVLAAPMLLHMQSLRGGGQYTTTLEAEVVYSSIHCAARQHATFMNDLFETFINEAYIPVGAEDLPSTKKQRRLAIIRKRYGLTRCPYYDDICPPDTAAWISRRYVHELCANDITFLVSKGRHNSPATITNISASTADRRVFERSNLEVWAINKKHTHELFLVH